MLHFLEQMKQQLLPLEGKMEMFYLRMHSTHFIYRYRTSDTYR